jgi:hypothetical protein
MLSVWAHPGDRRGFLKSEVLLSLNLDGFFLG